MRRIDALSAWDLLHESDARQHVQRKLQSDIAMFSRRMERSLRDSVEESMAEIEGAAVFDGLGYYEGAALAAGGVLAAGAVGAAAAAGGIATTTTATAILGLFTTGAVVTFSWPVFSVAAAVALAASYTSPAILGWATSSLRDRFKTHVRDCAERAMIADEANSVRMRFLGRLDLALDRRLAALEERS
ncbi:hypothetical protein [Sedimentitalea xiamensis]|nr:hypothetical protein [Sedimentitalea xiamensis]